MARHAQPPALLTVAHETAHHIEDDRGLTGELHERVREFAGLPADRVSLHEVPAMAISSTDCRHRVRSGEPVWYIVPDGVVQFIGKYGLYRTGEPADSP